MQVTLSSFIDDLVEGLELKSFESRYSVTGERAFSPRMLLKLWLFGALVHESREESLQSS
jgi:hypothetical protein